MREDMQHLPFLGLSYLTQHYLFRFRPKLMITFILYPVYMYHIFARHSSVEGHLVCFHFPARATRVAMNMSGQVFVDKNAGCLGHMPRRSIAGLYGRYIFSFLRILCAGFHGDCTSLQSSK